MYTHMHLSMDIVKIKLTIIKFGKNLIFNLHFRIFIILRLLTLKYLPPMKGIITIQEHLFYSRFIGIAS